MLETLAIIAYKQPVTRIEVEEIRTVDCSYSVQNLVRLGLVEVVGRKETIGKPLLFATTDDFLKDFLSVTFRICPIMKVYCKSCRKFLPSKLPRR